MFKKQVTVASTTLISSKDVKRIRTTLGTLYASTLSEEDIKALLPSKSEARWWRLSQSVHKSRRSIITCAGHRHKAHFKDDCVLDRQQPTAV